MQILYDSQTAIDLHIVAVLISIWSRTDSLLCWYPDWTVFLNMHKFKGFLWFFPNAYQTVLTSGLFCKGLQAIPRLILAAQNSSQTTASSNSDLTKIFIIVQQSWCFAGTFATFFCVSSIPHNASKAQPYDALVRESSDLTLAEVHFLYWKLGGKQIN